MIRRFLILLFASVLITMLILTIYASLDRAIWDVGEQLTSEPWFQATLADAYFGFLTFYAWVAYKETSWIQRLVWFVLIMTLGNIAMSIYMLIQLWSWKIDDGPEALLVRTR